MWSFRYAAAYAMPRLTYTCVVQIVAKVRGTDRDTAELSARSSDVHGRENSLTTMAGLLIDWTMECNSESVGG